MTKYILILLLTATQAFALTGTTLITNARMATIKSKVDARTQPQYNAWLPMKIYVDAHQNDPVQAPALWNVPSSGSAGRDAYVDAIDKDSNLVYKLALAYRITGNETYASNCVRILMGWARKVTFIGPSNPNFGPSGLLWSTRFSSFIIAADLIRSSPRFSASDQTDFKAFCRTKSLPMNTMGGGNNWGNWGCFFVVTTAAYLQDQALFNKAVARWQFFIQDQIGANGEMRYEISRGSEGLWYTNFALHAQALAAAVMKVNGVDKFNYVAPNGRTLKSPYFKAAAWSVNPCSYPYYHCPTHGEDFVGYMEILNLLPGWTRADATTLLNRYRPIDFRWSVPVLTLTHGNIP